MKVIRRSEYKKMKWKNGEGETEEIEVYPKTATLSESDFLWRVSCATMTSSNQFSRFPGYERILAVIEGDGLMVNDQRVDPFVPYRFSGDESVICQPLSPKVVDLGVIFNPKKVNAEMMVTSFWNRHQVQLFEATYFFYCAEGKVLAEEQELKVGDCLKVQGPGEIWLECSEPSVCFQIVIK